MTTITIDRSLLQQALDALTYQGTMGPTRRQRRAAAVAALRVALAAPATAPEPSWQDAPTVPGLWVSDFSWMAQKLGRETVEFYAKNRSIPSRRWYGPMPEDKP
jgi:hypothetical protein